MSIEPVCAAVRDAYCQLRDDDVNTYGTPAEVLAWARAKLRIRDGAPLTLTAARIGACMQRAGLDRNARIWRARIGPRRRFTVPAEGRMREVR